jgi:predicted Holliday junction resolvase-like endonuclease
MAELLVAGTFWFWLLIALEFMVLIWCLEYERYFFAPVTIAAVLVAMYFFGDLPQVGQWIWANKLWSLGILVGYFLVVGAPYAVIKWWSFVHDIREKNREEKKSWLGAWKQWSANLQTQIDRAKRSIEQLQTAKEKPWNADEQIKGFEENIAQLEAQKAIWDASNGVMTAQLLPLWKEVEQNTHVRDFFGRSTSIAKPEPENYKGRIELLHGLFIGHPACSGRC